MQFEFLQLALPFLTAFIISMLFGPGVIAALKRRKVGQTISADGPESHKSKAGTPTMGGLIILVGLLAAAFAISYVFRGMVGYGAAVSVYDLLAVVLLIGAYALLGLVDDYLTIHPIKGVRGIASKPKAAAQLLLAVAFVVWLSSHRVGFSPVLSFMGKPILSGALYWIFSILFITGMANFVNITDGLDGLVSGLTAIAAVAFVLIIALVPPHLGMAESFMLIGLLCGMAGACVAFLWFNANPAKVFMGDIGSLALGAALPAIAIITHREVLMIVVGLVFVLDGLSTAIQWAVFKYTRITTGTGRRVFKKSPVHHHFELCGWPEQNVVIRFWVVGIIAAVIAFAGACLQWW